MCQESNTKLRKKNLSIKNQPHVTMSHESADQNNSVVRTRHFGCSCICKESDSEQSFLIHVNINTEVMNANAEREIIAKAVFRSKRDNYLYEYLIQRRKQASFVKEIQVENSSYCA